MMNIIAQPLETWEVALYGLLTVTGMGILQFFITSYLKKSEQYKDQKIDDILVKIEIVGKDVKELMNKLSEQAIELTKVKKDIETLEKRLNHIEQKMNL